MNPDSICPETCLIRKIREGGKLENLTPECKGEDLFACALETQKTLGHDLSDEARRRLNEIVGNRMMF